MSLKNLKSAFANITKFGETVEKPTQEPAEFSPKSNTSSPEINKVDRTDLSKMVSQYSLIGDTRTTTQKTTPEIEGGFSSNVINFTTKEPNAVNPTPMKTTQEINAVNPTLDKTTQETNAVNLTPVKTTQEINAVNPTPVKTTQDTNVFSSTPQKTTVDPNSIIPTPNKKGQTPELDTFNPFPLSKLIDFESPDGLRPPGIVDFFGGDNSYYSSIKPSISGFTPNFNIGGFTFGEGEVGNSLYIGTQTGAHTRSGTTFENQSTVGNNFIDSAVPGFTSNFGPTGDTFGEGDVGNSEYINVTTPTLGEYNISSLEDMYNGGETQFYDSIHSDLNSPFNIPSPYSLTSDNGLPYVVNLFDHEIPGFTSNFGPTGDTFGDGDIGNSLYIGVDSNFGELGSVDFFGGINSYYSNVNPAVPGFTPNFNVGGYIWPDGLVGNSEYVGNGQYETGTHKQYRESLTFPGPVNFFDDIHANGFTNDLTALSDSQFNGIDNENATYDPTTSYYDSIHTRNPISDEFGGPVDFFDNTGADGFTLSDVDNPFTTQFKDITGNSFTKPASIMNFDTHDISSVTFNSQTTDGVDFISGLTSYYDTLTAPIPGFTPNFGNTSELPAGYNQPVGEAGISRFLRTEDGAGFQEGLEEIYIGTGTHTMWGESNLTLDSQIESGLSFLNKSSVFGDNPSTEDIVEEDFSAPYAVGFTPNLTSGDYLNSQFLGIDLEALTYTPLTTYHGGYTINTQNIDSNFSTPTDGELFNPADNAGEFGSSNVGIGLFPSKEVKLQGGQSVEFTHNQFEVLYNTDQTVTGNKFTNGVNMSLQNDGSGTHPSQGPGGQLFGASRGNEPYVIKNINDELYGTRMIPLKSTVDDTLRMASFIGSAAGIGFFGQETLLSQVNAYQPSFYDPTTLSSGVPIIGVNVRQRRDKGAAGGLLSLIGVFDDQTYPTFIADSVYLGLPQPNARDDYIFGEDIKLTKNVRSADLEQFTGPEVGRTGPHPLGYSLKDAPQDLMSMFLGGANTDPASPGGATTFVSINTSNENNQLNAPSSLRRYPASRGGFGLVLPEREKTTTYRYGRDLRDNPNKEVRNESRTRAGVIDGLGGDYGLLNVYDFHRPIAGGVVQEGQQTVTNHLLSEDLNTSSTSALDEFGQKYIHSDWWFSQPGIASGVVNEDGTPGSANRVKENKEDTFGKSSLASIVNLEGTEDRLQANQVNSMSPFKKIASSVTLNNYFLNQAKVNHENIGYDDITMMDTNVVDSEGTAIATNDMSVGIENTLENVQAQLEEADKVKHGMPLYFRDLRDGRALILRAYVAGLNESFSPSWSGENYIGRSEPVYTYTGNEREIGFTLKMVAQTSVELSAIYEKLNRLTSMTYPEYKGSGERQVSLQDQTGAETGEILTLNIGSIGEKTRMKAPLLKFRMGELYGNGHVPSKEVTGFLNALSYTFPDESPWETVKGFRVPKYVDIEITFKVIHDEVPSLDFARVAETGQQQSFYGVNQNKAPFTTNSVTNT